PPYTVFLPYPTLFRSPNLAVSDARAAIAFYEAAFGAETLDVFTAGDAVIHSDLVLRSAAGESTFTVAAAFPPDSVAPEADGPTQDRKSTRLNSSHVKI